LAKKDLPQTNTSFTTIPRAAHNISRADISESALKVLYRLKSAGFAGYLVGGGVRDLLLGREPKDFDVVTDARPEDVKKLFQHCRLIGRRFRLAHVRFGREVIEVATFRAQTDASSEGDRVTVNGRILQDNVYGTLEEDVWRRDFSINCLYYNIRDFSVADFTGGMTDLQSGIVRLVGAPDVRYREDPVRILRAIRFAAALGFRIHPETEAPIGYLGALLLEVPPARLYEEVLKLFHGGYALRTFELLRHYGAFGYLFPSLEKNLELDANETSRNLVTKGLENTDLRVTEGKPVTAGYLFAVLLWAPMRCLAYKYRQGGMSEITAQQIASKEVIASQSAHTAMPRRIGYMCREIWALQQRLLNPKKRDVLQLLTHSRFRAAYDFLLLRAETGDNVNDNARWWTDFQNAEDNQRQVLLEQLGRRRRKRPSRRRQHSTK
jgi:poly(A) polymerase